jgi:hypothetical protein
MMNADEVFLTNAVHGIVWVELYKTKTYSNKMAIYFNDKLNQLVTQ